MGNAQDLNAVADRVAAKLKATSVAAEESNAKIAASAEAAGSKFGAAFDAGTAKAAGALGRLSAVGATFGIPMIESLDKVGHKLEETSAKHDRLVQSMSKAGGTILAAGAAGFAAVAGEAVHLGEAYQTAQASIQTATGVTEQSAAKMTAAFGGVAGKFEQSGQQMEQAFAGVSGQLKLTEGHALSAGEAMRVMTAATELADGTGSNLAATTSDLASVMQTYHLSVGQATGASDTLFNVSKALGVPIDGVAQALDKLKGRMGALAPTLHDSATLMTELGEHGITGTRGIMLANTAFQTLAGNSKNTQALLKGLGVDVFDASGHFVGLQGVISQLQPKFAQMTQQQQTLAAQMLFGKGASQAMLQVIQGGIPAYNAAAQAASRLGTAHQAATAQSHTFHGELLTLKAAAETLGGDLGVILIPKITALAQALTTGIGWLEKHKAAAEALGIAIGGPLAAAVAVFAGTKMLALVTSLGKGVQAIGGLAQSAVQGAATMVSRFTAIGAGAGTMAAEVEAADTAIVTSADATAAGVDTALGSTGIGLILVGVGVAATELGTHWSDVMGAMKDAVNFMVEEAEKALNLLIGLLNNAISLFNSTIGQLAGQIGSIGNVGVGAVFGGGSGSSSSVGMADTRYGVVNTNSSGGGPILPNLPRGSNSSLIATYLKGQGFSNVAIAGILGNFAQETGGGSLAGINTADSGDGRSGMGGLGIAQWTQGRYYALKQLAKSEGVAPTSLAVQLQFLDQELRGPYHSAFAAIQHASSPAAAAAAFNKLFEGGTDPGGIRERAAGVAYGMLGAGGAGVPSVPGLPGNLAALLGGSGSGSGGRATMRYVGHRPVGVMTEAQWQAYQAAHPTTTRSLLYANPLPGMTSVGRTDMGVDYSATPGSAVDAIGAGRIVSVLQNWYQGQPLVEEQLSQGPNKGRFVYYAEQLRSLVRAGQQVAAGQRIGTVAASGTGLELGFGAPGGRTLAQATTGYSEGQATPAGRAFLAWMRSVGSGVYQTTNHVTGAVTGGGPNVAISLAQLEQAFVNAITKAGDSLLTKLGNAIQNGTVKVLEATLGVSTSGTMPERYRRWTTDSFFEPNAPWRYAMRQVPTSQVIADQIHGLGTSASISGIDTTLGGLVGRISANSPQQRAYEQEVASLRATGQGGLADALVAAHKAAMATMAQQLYAEQLLHDNEITKVQTTELKDQTTLIQNSLQAQLNVTKAGYQLTNDVAQAQLTAIQDQTQTLTDRFSEMVTAVQDATQAMTDATDMTVSGLNDQTQVQVDLLGERGLYGLNLVAQRLQVQLDVTKAYYDQQIALAQRGVDLATTQAHFTEAIAQQGYDQTKSTQDLAAAAAQQQADRVTMIQLARIQQAQAKLDALTLHLDVTKIGPAQTALDLMATAPRSIQDVLQRQLDAATGNAGRQEAQAGLAYAGVYGDAQARIAGADQIATAASSTAQQVIANANLSLQAVIGQGNLAVANAQQGLTSVKDAALLAQTPQENRIGITKATASTQFAGTGSTINIYGADLSNPSAVRDEVSWAFRTQLQVPA